MSGVCIPGVRRSEVIPLQTPGGTIEIIDADAGWMEFGWDHPKTKIEDAIIPAWVSWLTRSDYNPSRVLTGNRSIC